MPTPSTPARRRRVGAAALVLVVAVLAAAPAAILWATVTWTDRDDATRSAAREVALATAAELGTRLAAGSDDDAAHAAAVRAGRARATSLGVPTGRASLTITTSGTADTRVLVRVDVHVRGTGRRLAQLVLGEALGDAHATARMRRCTDVPHLDS